MVVNFDKTFSLVHSVDYPLKDTRKVKLDLHTIKQNDNVYISVTNLQKCVEEIEGIFAYKRDQDNAIVALMHNIIKTSNHINTFVK